jgi:Thioredoxin 2, N-terminal
MPDTQLIRCPNCGATNRVPREKVAQGLEPICGRCKYAMSIAMMHSLSRTVGTVSRKVLDQAKCPVLIVRITDQRKPGAGMLET